MRVRALAPWTCGALALGVLSCGLIAGVRDGTPYPDAGADGTSEPPVCVETSPEKGFFVSNTGAGAALACDAGGALATACTKEVPCKDLQTAFCALAVAPLRGSIFVAEGTYGGARIDGVADVTVQGGFNGTFSERCNRAAGKHLVVVNGDAKAPAVEVGDFVAARFESLEIRAADTSVSSASTYGLLASTTRSGAKLVLVDTNVIAGAAGAGQAGAAGTKGINGASDCVSGDGSAGAPGAPGAPAPAGTFAPKGYVAPPVAGSGGAGGPGSNGVAGTPAPTLGCESGSQCIQQPKQGLPGTSGCGGGAGAGGAGGGAGGGSFAVYAWGAGVEVRGGLLRANGGGSAGDGGAGGAGGNGGSGSAGKDSTCGTGSCQQQLLPGGGAGGQGGSGGAGGAGGRGVDGPSCAVVVNQGGQLTFGSGASCKQATNASATACNGLPGNATPEGCIP